MLLGQCGLYQLSVVCFISLDMWQNVLDLLKLSHHLIWWRVESCHKGGWWTLVNGPNIQWLDCPLMKFQQQQWSFIPITFNSMNIQYLRTGWQKPYSKVTSDRRTMLNNQGITGVCCLFCVYRWFGGDILWESQWERAAFIFLKPVCFLSVTLSFRFHYITASALGSPRLTPRLLPWINMGLLVHIREWAAAPSTDIKAHQDARFDIISTFFISVFNFHPTAWIPLSSEHFSFHLLVPHTCYFALLI